MTATLIAGSVFGGPEWNQNLAADERIAAILGLSPDPLIEASKFLSTLRRLRELLEQFNVTVESGSADSAGVAVQFIVPGSISQPDFEGCRAGLVTNPNREMVVETAVPVTVALSQERGDPSIFFGAALLEAVDFAEHHFEQQGVLGDFSRVRSIGRAVQSAMLDLPPD